MHSHVLHRKTTEILDMAKLCLNLEDLVIVVWNHLTYPVDCRCIVLRNKYHIFKYSISYYPKGCVLTETSKLHCSSSVKYQLEIKVQKERAVLLGKEKLMFSTLDHTCNVRGTHSTLQLSPCNTRHMSFKLAVSPTIVFI